MKIEDDITIHYSIGKYGQDFYETPCGLTGGKYYVTKNKEKFTCRLCKEALDEKK